MYVSSVYAMSWCGSVMVHNDVDVYDYVYVDGHAIISTCSIMKWKCNDTSVCRCI